MEDSPDLKLRNDLIKGQYDLLKDTIKNSRKRMHQLSLAGVISFPAGVLLAGSKFTGGAQIGASALFIFSPIIILAFGMLYRSERAALRKYGHYINYYIDPWMGSPESKEGLVFVSWEQFRRGRYKEERSVFQSEYEHTRNLSLRLLIGTYIIAGCVLSSHEIAYLIFDENNKISLIEVKRYAIFVSVLIIELRAAAFAWQHPEQTNMIMRKMQKWFGIKSSEL